MVSILLLMIDRASYGYDTLIPSLERADYPYELLVFDNGSTQPEMEELYQRLRPQVLIRARENYGIPTGFNTLINLAKGTHLCCISADIMMPSRWLRRMVEDYERIPDAGMCAIHCVETLPDALHHPIPHHPCWNAFGPCLWSREVQRKVGYFNQDYSPYGLEDSDMHYRMVKSGLTNFYIYGVRAEHRGHDVGNGTEYRRIKDESLGKNLSIFNRNIRSMDESGNYYVGWEGQKQ